MITLKEIEEVVSELKAIERHEVKYLFIKT